MAAIEPGPVSQERYPLKDALELIGITAPTFYRWIRDGKIQDYRIRGDRNEVYLSGEDVRRLRSDATHVKFRE
jgi:excisionase family DNA binding protein